MHHHLPANRVRYCARVPFGGVCVVLGSFTSLLCVVVAFVCLGRSDPCTSVVAKDGYAVASFTTGHIRLYDLTSKSLAVEIAAHARCITALDMHPSLDMVCGCGCGCGAVAVSVIVALCCTTSPVPVHRRFQFVAVSEGASLSLWSVPGADKGATEVELLFTKTIDDQMLTGVQFLKTSTPHIVTSAYDVTTLSVLPMA